jgi:hypothetical protein
MREKYIAWILLTGFWLFGCNDIDSVGVSERSSFIKFYGFALQNEAKSLEELPEGGYLISASNRRGGIFHSTVFFTDPQGNITREFSIPGFEISDLLREDQALYLVGDSVSLQGNRKFMVLSTNFTGVINQTFVLDDGEITNSRDFHGHSIRALRRNNSGHLTHLVALGSAEKPNSSQKESFLVELNASDLQLGWQRKYSLELRSYEVGKNLMYYPENDSLMLWVNSATAVTGLESNLSSYISIQVAQPNSTSVNNPLFGQNDSNNQFASEITRSSFDGGFAVIGTVQVSPTNSSILFFRTNLLGDIKAETINTYQRGGRESGNSLTSTNDGGFLLVGTLTTTPTIGNGGTDFLLIRINHLGEVLWEKLLGGSGNESAEKVIQTRDGGFAILGTQVTNDVSVISLIKLKENGELTN